MENSTLLSFFILILATSTQQSQYPLPQNGIHPNNMVGVNGLLNNGQIPHTGPAGNLNYQQPLVPQPVGNLFNQQLQVPQPPHIPGMNPNMLGGSRMMNIGQHPLYPNPVAGNPHLWPNQVPRSSYFPGQMKQMPNAELGTFIALPGGYGIVKNRKPIYPPQCYFIQNLPFAQYPKSNWEPIQKIIDNKIVTTELLNRTYLCTDKYNVQFFILQTIKYGKIAFEDTVTESKIIDKYYNKLGQEGLWVPW